MATFGNSAGESAGLRGGSTWNYGFLAGVRKLREEEETPNIIKGRTMPPGARDYFSKAWSQWNGGAHSNGSGYENDPKDWSKKMTMPRMLPGIDGSVDGYNPNWDYEEVFKGRQVLTSRMKAQNHIKPIEPGVDGCVEAGVYAVKDKEEAPAPPRQPRQAAPFQAQAANAGSTLSIKGGARTATTEGSRLSVAKEKLRGAVSDRSLMRQIRGLIRQGGLAPRRGGGGED